MLLPPVPYIFLCLLFLCPEKEVSTSLRNVGNIPPDYTASYGRTQYYSQLPPTQPQISRTCYEKRELEQGWVWASDSIAMA